MAEAMRDVDPNRLNRSRAADAAIRQHMQAISDQRAYGSGCDFDPRGNRDLDQLGEGASHAVYSGPKGYDPAKTTGRHEYQPRAVDQQAKINAGPTGQLRVPSWGGDDGKPARDYNNERRR
jgi:hypothetical protein